MAQTGRPPVVTAEIISKLEQAFLIGATDKEACFVAGIGMSTLYDYCKANPEFSERKEALKDMPKYTARANVVKAIDEGDKNTSTWYLERKAKSEFAQKTEVQQETTIMPVLVKFLDNNDTNNNRDTNGIS